MKPLHTALNKVNKLVDKPLSIEALRAFAKDFDNKTCLIDNGSIRACLGMFEQGNWMPVIKSRYEGFYRLLPYLVNLDGLRLWQISTYFGKPARLGPIADAIKAFGEERTNKCK